MKLDPYISRTPHKKTTSKWIKDLNGRPKIIKLLEETTGQKLCDTGFGNDTKGRSNKRKIDKLDFMKSKIFCASKDTPGSKKATREGRTNRWNTENFLGHHDDSAQ